jgi:flagellar hook-length control protein FliK
VAQRAARLAAGLRPDANVQGRSAITSNGLDQDGPLSGAVLQNTQDMRSAVVPEPRTIMPVPEPGAQPELSSRAVDAPASTASGLAPASARGADTTTSPSVMQLPDIRQAPQGSEFPQEILARVRMIQSQNGKEARLNLHPAELGRLQIAITSEGEATRVAFVVENAQAKEALEQAMPRLREFLQQAGLQLTDSSVAQQDFRDSSGFASGDDEAEQKGSALAGDSDGEQDAPGPSGSDPDRIVDAYV